MCLNNGNYRQTYDVQVVETRITHKICANTYCLYQRSKSMFVVSARDFCLVGHYSRDSDGAISILVFSDASVNDAVPAGKPVRARCLVGGWYLQPVAG